MTKTSNFLTVFTGMAIALFGLAAFAQANVIVRTGETVSVAEDQDITGDFYAAASIINISSKVEGDLVAAGGRVTTNGEVTEDVLVIGGSVDVHSPVGDDLRVVGGEVVIAEPVTGDVFVIGGSVSILSTASVGGDVLVFGGDVEISGPVGGDILGHSGTLRIDGAVAGDVNVTTNSLTVGERADIGGSVTYVSSQLVERSPAATIGGDLLRNDPVVISAPSNFKNILVPVLVVLFTVLVWFLIARRFLEKVVMSAAARRPRPVLIGLGTLLLAPFAITILMVSVLGTFVGIITLFAYILLILVSIVALMPLAGHLILKVFNQPTTEVTLVTLGAGVVTVFLLMIIPVIGPVLIFGLFILTLGALVDTVVHSASNT